MSEFSFGNKHDDNDWGASFTEVLSDPSLDNIFVGHVNVSELKNIAERMSDQVISTSWINKLDDTRRRSYERTAKDTSAILIELFKGTLVENNKVVSEFGEFLISIGSSRALEIIFGHRVIPIAELWKPKLLGNEGFDFHTVCAKSLVNFGESKFSTSDSPYGGNSGESTGAGGQADGFINEEKHLRDTIHLEQLAGVDATKNLNDDKFGIVLAFSMNAKKPLLIFKNAVETAREYIHLKKAANIYIIGVSHAAEN